MTDMNAQYERNIASHPAYGTMKERLQAEFAELAEAEQAVHLQVAKAEESVASLRGEIPILEQRYLDAASYQEQHKIKAKLEEAQDKLYFVELELAGLRVALATTQIENAKAKKEFYDRLIAEKREELLPLLAAQEALSHTAERNTGNLRHLIAHRGALERQKEELEITRRQQLQRGRLPGLRNRPTVLQPS